MCGIFGYVGTRTAEPILIEGLRTLEYRGYDSAGIFVPGYGAVKAVGPIDNLAAAIHETIGGTSGIAHTRWATHGEPTQANAHPHSDMSKSVWIVHNGIIENYRELKEGLIAQGMKFESATDTEVLAKLIGTLYNGDLVAAVRDALHMVRGTYGLAVMSERAEGEIVVARMGSPIVLGIGKDGYFVSSDPSALLVHTKDVVYLDDGEMAHLTKDGYSVTSLAGKVMEKSAEKIAWDFESTQKQGYEHFMLKEIFEAPEVIANTIRGRLVMDKGRSSQASIAISAISPIKRVLSSLCHSQEKRLIRSHQFVLLKAKDS